MRHLLIRWAALGVAVALAVRLTDGIDVDGGFVGYVGVAAVLGLVNALIRPVVRSLTLPITLVTLGLFSIVVNALMLLLAAAFSSALSVDGFGQAMFGAIIISVASAVLNLLVVDRKRDS